MSVNNKGFSLPEIMIAMGLLAGISLVTMKVLDNQAENEGRLKSSSEIQKTVALLKVLLNNPETCRHMLLGQPLSPNLNGVTDIIRPASVPTTEQPGLYQRIKNHSTGTFTYKEILALNSNYGRFRIGGAGSIQLVKVTDSNSNIDAIDLLIRFRRETNAILFRDSSNTNDKVTIQRIPLMVTFDGANRITDCGLVVSDSNIAARKKLCDSMGALAQWVGTPTNRCYFRPSQCGPGEVPEMQNKLGTQSLNCVPVENQFNVLDLFDTAYPGCVSATGEYRLAEVTVSGAQKLRLVCN